MKKTLFLFMGGCNWLEGCVGTGQLPDVRVNILSKTGPVVRKIMSSKQIHVGEAQEVSFLSLIIKQLNSTPMI